MTSDSESHRRLSDTTGPPRQQTPGRDSTVAFHSVVPQPRADRYVVNKFHARGGMGEIWLGQDVEIGRQVAVKTLRHQRGELNERFVAEAQITGQLEHPSIVPVHDLGMGPDGSPFYVMKFVQGRTLKEAIEEHHGEPAASASSAELQRLTLLETFVDLCHAVAYAHSRGVIHRDLKPDNVMLGQFGETLLLDWGLAKILGAATQPEGGTYVHPTSTGASSETQLGSVLGAPAYMAPEVAEGRAAEVDERTDVYLLGGTLYQILTGNPPREGSSNDEMIELARTTPPVRPRRLNPRVARALEAVCMKAMSIRPQDRYATAMALADDVQHYLAGEAVSAYREAWSTRAWRWCKRHRTGLGRAAVAALLLGVLAASGAMIREARLETERLRQLDLAQADVAEFRRSADGAKYLLTSMIPVAEQNYFEPSYGEQLGRRALGALDGWGAGLEQLPLDADRQELKEEWYETCLLLVHSQLGRADSDPPTARQLLELLHRAARLHPPTTGYFSLRSELLRALGDLDQSAADQQRAEDPSKPMALDHFLRGERLFTRAALGKPEVADPRGEHVEPLERALAEYQQAVRLDPDHYWSHFKIAWSYQGLARFQEAVHALGACLALRPQAPWGYAARGVAQAGQGNFDEALRDLDYALELDDSFLAARFQRGVVYWMQREWEPALADFDFLMNLPAGERFIEAASYRGQIYLQQNKPQQALADFDALLAEKPVYRSVYLERAGAHLALGQQPQALADLNAFLAAGQAAFELQSPVARHQRGGLLRRLAPRLPRAVQRKTHELALAQLQQALQGGLQSAQLFDDLGAVLENLGRPRQAMAAYTKGVELNPHHINLRNKRGWAYVLKFERPKLALQDFAAAAAVNTTSLTDRLAQVESYTGVGYVQAIRNDTAAAQNAATRALALLQDSELGDSFAIQHNLACIYGELSKTDQARKQQWEDTAMLLLDRAVQLAKRTGAEAEQQRLMEADFPPAMQAREDFRALKERLAPPAAR